jgi:hypothetical protein
LALQIRCPAHDGKSISRQKAENVLYEDTVDIVLKRSGPSVKFREFEFMLAREGRYPILVEIIGHANGTYGNEDQALAGRNIPGDRRPALPRV